jgi:predicted nucleotidyltransferase
MNSVGTILETGHDALRTLCPRCHVRRLDLFGSAVTDRFDPLRSDVDMWWSSSTCRSAPTPMPILN